MTLAKDILPGFVRVKMPVFIWSGAQGSIVLEDSILPVEGLACFEAARLKIEYQSTIYETCSPQDRLQVQWTRGQILPS
jgi:hypothetical protein